MPADIVGSMIMESDERGGKTLRFQYGPIFANLVLADENSIAPRQDAIRPAGGDAGAHRDFRHHHP